MALRLFEKMLDRTAARPTFATPGTRTSAEPPWLRSFAG